MPSYKDDVSADFINEGLSNSSSTGSDDISEQNSESGMVSERIQNEDSDDSSDEIRTSAGIESFNDEDKLNKLYEKIADDIVSNTNIENVSISELMRQTGELLRRLRSGEISSSKPTYNIKSLTMYAHFHTGLVRNIIRDFFRHKKLTAVKRNRLNVVSLCGGPGYDMEAFCSALKESRDDVEEINFTIIDSKEWTSEFKTKLKTANVLDIGSLSELLKDIKICFRMISADLNTDGIFKDEPLSSTINEADFILAVKLDPISSTDENKRLIKNVVDTMKVGSKFIFIYRHDNDLFNNISSVSTIYDGYQEYLPNSDGLKGNSSRSKAKAHIRVFEKHNYSIWSMSCKTKPN